MSRNRERKKQERARRTGVRAEPQRLTAKRLMADTAAKARKTAEVFLGRADLSDHVVELAERTQHLALRVMSDSPLSGKHECRAGCDFCCHTAVTVAPPEVFAIVRYLREHYDDATLADVREKIERNATLAASVSRDDYIAKLVPCALKTDDGNCLAYPVRPIACAGFLSTSQAKCAAEFERVPDREPVPTDKYAMHAGLGVSNGLLEACRHAGFDGQFYELHHALRLALDSPDAIERWARRENVFAGCMT